MFAVTDVKGVTASGGTAAAAFSSALTPAAAKAVLIIATVGHFFFNDTATTKIYTAQYTLSLHDALPISTDGVGSNRRGRPEAEPGSGQGPPGDRKSTRLNSSHIEPSRMPSSA